MKKHEYTAKVNTGDLLSADSMRVLYRNLRHYFESFPNSYYAEIRIDDRPRAFAWKTPDGINVVQIME